MAPVSGASVIGITCTRLCSLHSNWKYDAYVGDHDIQLLPRPTIEVAVGGLTEPLFTDAICLRPTFFIYLLFDR